MAWNVAALVFVMGLAFLAFLRGATEVLLVVIVVLPPVGLWLVVRIVRHAWTGK